VPGELARPDDRGRRHADRRGRRQRHARNHHPGRQRRAPGHLQRPAALLLHQDKAPGDTLGIYTNWREIVLAAAATPAPTAQPTEAPAPTESPLIATPPPTSTPPVGGGSGPDGGPLPVLLVAGIAALGFLVAIRRLAAARVI
jgi:hypothetical protein